MEWMSWMGVSDSINKGWKCSVSKQNSVLILKAVRHLNIAKGFRFVHIICNGFSLVLFLRNSS